MPNKRNQQVLIISRLMIDIWKLHTDNPPMPDFDRDHGLIIYAVLIGDLQGKSRKLAQLERATGIARPTLLRKIKSLMAANVIIKLERGCYKIHPDVRANTKQTSRTDSMVKLVREAAKNLSKLDAIAA